MNTERSADNAWSLCLTHCEGQRVDLRWPWPAGQQRCDLAQVLSALEQPALEQEDMANCGFFLTPGAGAPAMAVQHACAVLRCSLNGHLLPAGQLAWLQDGDVLEIGLCRVQLLAGAPTTSASEHGDSGEPAWPEIELTQLAAPSTRADSAPDALDDLLGSARRADAPLPSEAPAASPAVGAARAQAPQSPVTTRANAVAGEPLQEWHALYLRRLESPQAALGDIGWRGVTQQAQQAAADPLQELMRQASERGVLSDLLGESEHISSVLAQLDAAGHSDLLAPESPVNVLHLFAPEGWQAPDLTQQVPLLNRQEHHGIALDSALSWSTNPAPTQPKESS